MEGICPWWFKALVYTGNICLRQNNNQRKFSPRPRRTFLRYVCSVPIITLKLYYSLGKLLFLKTCHENNPQGMHVRLCKHFWNIDWSLNPQGLANKKWRLGATLKYREFSSVLPQGDYAMLITWASVQFVQKHHRENTSPWYDQSSGLLSLAGATGWRPTRSLSK